MMDKASKRVTIDVLGHQYAIKTDGDEEYVQRVADYVNAKSLEVREVTQTVSTLDLFIKVALNLADELLQERASGEVFRKAVKEASRALAQEIAAHLDGVGQQSCSGKVGAGTPWRERSIDASWPSIVEHRAPELVEGSTEDESGEGRKESAP